MWLSLVRALLGIWLETQACALTGNRTRDSLVCRQTLNPLSHTSQETFKFLLNLSEEASWDLRVIRKGSVTENSLIGVKILRSIKELQL